MRAVMKLSAAIILAALPVAAHADSYAVVCITACTAADGTTQPAGTVLNAPIAWDGTSAWTPPPGTQAVPYTGQVAYSPVVVPTTIDPEDFLNRFTSAEQQAVSTAAITTWQVQLWMTQLAAASTIDVTNAKIVAGVATLVRLNLLTSARAAQVLDLTRASP